MYYACFYAVSALLVKEKIAAHTHSGTRQMFGLHFIQTQKIKLEHGKTYSKLFEKRQTGDYEDFMLYNIETLDELMPLAKALIDDIEKYLA